MSELRTLLELLGEDTTLKLVETYGGTRVGVPKTKRAKHPLRDLLGDKGYGNLHQYFGGSEMSVPLAKRWRVEIYARDKAKTTKEIALKAGYTERAVYRILSGDTRVPGQLVLAFESGTR